jgi:hypothetical protein
MPKKLRLDTLLVDSFPTTDEGSETRGTVMGRGPEPTPPLHPCTCNPTDLCKTAYYWCGTGPYTIYSCDYTHNGSCAAATS